MVRVLYQTVRYEVINYKQIVSECVNGYTGRFPPRLRRFNMTRRRRGGALPPLTRTSLHFIWVTPGLFKVMNWWTDRFVDKAASYMQMIQR